MGRLINPMTQIGGSHVSRQIWRYRPKRNSFKQVLKREIRARVRRYLRGKDKMNATSVRRIAIMSLMDTLGDRPQSDLKADVLGPSSIDGSFSCVMTWKGRKNKAHKVRLFIDPPESQS